MTEENLALIGFGVSFAVCGALLFASRRLGGEMQAPGRSSEKSEGARPVREHSVPKWGGWAVLAGLMVLGSELPWAAVVTAFLLGAIDDRWDLQAGSKALLQCVPAALVAWHFGGSDGIWLGALAWVAQNALNTWDHADGFVCALTGIALPGVLAAPFIGVLPWNLLLRTRSPEGRDVPRVYLGDAGSHVAGIVLIAHPMGRWFLILPLLDLGRVVLERIRAGDAPWLGDRRHLGHRFLEKEWPPKVGAVLVVAAAAPIWLLPERGPFLAVAGCLIAYGLLVYLTAEVGPAGSES